MEKLNYHDRLMFTAITDAAIETKPENLLEFLFSKGFIDSKVVERYTVRKEVLALLHSGMPRMRVIEELSYKYCCSFEKIRGIVYNHTSDNAEFVAAFKQFRSNEKRATK